MADKLYVLNTLGLSKANYPSTEFVDFNVPERVRFIRYYHDRSRTDDGKRIEEILSKDPRIKRLLGKLVSSGGGTYSLFEVNNLVMWFLWYSDRTSVSDAVEALIDYLNTQRLSYTKALWVYGLTSSSKINFSDGITLTPVSEMPDSTDKTEFESNNLSIMPHVAYERVQMPKAAFTLEASGPKIMPESDNTDPEDLRLSRKLYDYALVLNLVPRVGCAPGPMTQYLLNAVPPGPFGGSSSSTALFDIPANRQANIEVTEEMLANNNLELAYIGLSKLEGKEYERWQLILVRLSQAKRRLNYADKILDLGIILEMVLLDDLDGKEQLALTFRLRGAKLMGVDEKSRDEIYTTLRDIYDFRSQVAHGGQIRGGTQKLRNNMDQYLELTCLMCAKVLITEKIDWKKVILN